MASKFTWIPVFKAVADWLAGYEARQPELVGILKSVGIDTGLDDRDKNGSTIPLTEIDPFTFFCMFTKYGVNKRKQLFANLITQAGLQVEPPIDFDGVPTANAMKARMFPFRQTREDWMISTLWQLFKESRAELHPDTFARVLRVPGTGFAKLTEVLFYVDPDRYFPVDAQTRPLLQEMGLSKTAPTLAAYRNTLTELRKQSSKPFAELSHDAWEKNQQTLFDAQTAMEYLDDRYPNTYSGTSHIAVYRTPEGRQLAFDPGTSPARKATLQIFVDALPQQIQDDRIGDYPPGRARNHHLGNHAPHLAAGQQAYTVSVSSMEELAELCEWYESALPAPAITVLPDSRLTMNNQPLNQILYGPPGTGKTFATIDKALSILDPDFAALHADDRAALKARYDELAAEHRIRFVTFHQSFSYEDFVEGLRAENDGGTLQYRVEPGVFRSICDDARGSAQVASDIGVRENARIWKISIDGTVTPSQTRSHCFANGEARIGWSTVGDLKNQHLAEVPAYASLGTNDRSSLRDFSQEIEPGDVLLCIGSEDQFQAVGVVQGEYGYQATPPTGVRSDYVNVLPVHWLATNLSLDIRPLNGGRKFTLKTVYELGRFGWPELADYLEAASIKLEGAEPAPRSKAQSHVLIIDEINRGNISRIFGELITLIEPSKRKGADEALEVVLPYSKKKFNVPDNVYLIGTMNTADRSLAGLDIALRRRFKFLEMPPKPETLAGRNVAGVDLQRLLVAMNRRIEVLLGRDYLLGHAYFLGIDDLSGLADIFRHQVLPLLQEYFFEDWQRIAWVLNDQAKTDDGHRFLIKETASPSEVFGANVDLPQDNDLWRINGNAFDKSESYAGILKAG